MRAVLRAGRLAPAELLRKKAALTACEALDENRPLAVESATPFT
jgi:hypothetical protein